MYDDMMRIKTWHFSIRQHRELIPRSILAMHVSASTDLNPCLHPPSLSSSLTSAPSPDPLSLLPPFYLLSPYPYVTIPYHLSLLSTCILLLPSNIHSPSCATLSLFSGALLECFCFSECLSQCSGPPLLSVTNSGCYISLGVFSSIHIFVILHLDPSPLIAKPLLYDLNHIPLLQRGPVPFCFMHFCASLKLKHSPIRSLFR